jgi:hypothetical protein
LRYTLGTLCLKAGEAEAAASHLQAALRQDARRSASWKYPVPQTLSPYEHNVGWVRRASH